MYHKTNQLRPKDLRVYSSPHHVPQDRHDVSPERGSLAYEYSEGARVPVIIKPPGFTRSLRAHNCKWSSIVVIYAYGPSRTLRMAARKRNSLRGRRILVERRETVTVAFFRFYLSQFTVIGRHSFWCIKLNPTPYIRY